MKGIFLNIFFRSFFIQTLWNYKGMQNLGFLFSVYPFLKKIYKNINLQKSLLNHLGFFNTHPYLANFIIGLVCATEEKNNDFSKANNLKNLYSGPLASFGDTFFWSSLRPFIMLISLIPFIIFNSEKTSFIAVLLFILIYNLFHMYFRFFGLYYGYYNPQKFLSILKFINQKKIIGLINLLGLVISTIIVLFYLIKFISFFSIIFFSVSLFLVYKNVSLSKILIVLVFFTVLSVVFQQ